MTFKTLLLSKTFYIPAAILALFAFLLSFFPLVGALGFEYSVFIAFIASFLSVFISSEMVLKHTAQGSRGGKRFADLITTIFALNLILLSIPFLLALLVSLMKTRCDLREGMSFYLLIPVVSVFFSTSLGVMLGGIFERRGFLLSSFVLIGTILYSLWNLYWGLPIFSYNAVFGFFPGPLYDDVIDITSTLIAYRVYIACWGLAFLTFLNVFRKINYNAFSPWEALTSIVVVTILLLFFGYREELGFHHTREYITSHYLNESFETENFILYYSSGSWASAHIELIAGDHEWRYAQLSEYLKVSPKRKILSYIYPSEASRKYLMGAGQTTLANPIHGEIHITYNSFPHKILKHELTHVLSADFGIPVLKISPKVGLIEGLAVAADWEGATTPHMWSAALIELGAAPEVEDILGYGFWVGAPAISYTVMGSFSRYLIDVYGMDRFKLFYKTGDLGIYNMKSGEIVNEWKEFLKGFPVSEENLQFAIYRFGEKSIFEGTCPRKIGDLKAKAIDEYRRQNYKKSVSYLLSALQFRPGDPILIQTLAYADYYGANYEDLYEIAASYDSLSTIDTNILNNLVGNALWQQGKTEKAKDIFVSLRDKELPLDLVRVNEIKIHAIDAGGRREDYFRGYFSTRDKLVQTAILGDLVNEFPQSGSGYLLLGAIFYKRGDYKIATQYLDKASNLDMPSLELKLKILRNLGISYFAVEDYKNAALTFEKFRSLAPDPDIAKIADDLLLRTQWIVKMGSLAVDTNKIPPVY